MYYSDIFIFILDKLLAKLWVQKEKVFLMKIKLNALERFDKNDFLKIAFKLGVGNATEIYWENYLTHIAL